MALLSKDKTTFDKVGFFDETLEYYADDLDWFMRAREVGVAMLILEQVTVFWRMHERNTSRDKSVRDLGLAEAFKKSLDRRRRRGNGLIASVPRFSDFDEANIRKGRKASKS